MKTTITFLMAVFFISLGTSQGVSKVISCHFHHEPFASFCKSINEKSKVHVYFKEEWTKDIYASIDNDSITVLRAVETILKGTDLEVSEWNQNLVVLKSERLLKQLPAFRDKSLVADSLLQREKVLTVSEERYITGRKAGALQTIQIGKTGGTRGNTKAKLQGRLLDEETGEPVSYGNMYITEIESGAVADFDGFFTIFLKPGHYNAQFEFLGYEKKKYLLDVLSDGAFTIIMKKAIIQMKELVIHGDKQMNITAKDPGIEKILMKTIRNVPMMMGERNILTFSSLLPGIVNAGEGAAGLNVRGGGSDQNAFYLNKIPVYNTSHLFGFFPAFNSDIIKDFSIYKGFIPAQYGGRLSSVFNINTRQGNLKHYTAHGGLSPITGNIVVEGPIKKDTCSFILSARTSYSDWILRRIKDPTLRASSASFYDLSGGVNYDIQKTQVALFGYHSYDHFRLSDMNEYAYTNNGASLNINHRYTNALHGEFSLVMSQYKFTTAEREEASRAYRHSYQIGHYEAKADFVDVLNEKNTLNYGVGFLFYDLQRGIVSPYDSFSLRIPVDLGSEHGLESSVYISDSYDAFDWLNVTAGIRYAMFNPLGAKTVYTYTPGFPKDISYINDTLSFGSGKPIRWYSEPDIRAAANIETDDNGSVKIAFNRTHQNLFMLNNTITIAPNAQWKLADYHLKPSMADQYSFGIFRTLGALGLEASVEFYYKQTNNFSEFRDGADFLGNSLVETAVLQGRQKAYGVEFFLKRNNRKFEGWISYTYSRSKVTIDGGFPWNRINEGQEYPTNYDIPHALNIVLTYHTSRRVIFSSIVTYQRGKPITYPISVFYVDGQPRLDFSSRNAYRIPDYFRIDVSGTFEGTLKKNKLVHSAFSINVFNLAGRENPYSVYFKTVDGRIKSYLYSVIGIPVLTASWIFKFGNYASE